MNDLETCREQILSEDTRDFISNPLRTPLFNELLKKDPLIVNVQNLCINL